MSAATLQKQDMIPYTLSLPDGNTLFVRIPARMTGRDRDGSLTIKQDGMRFLDKVRVLATQMPDKPSSGYIKTIRAALSLTQADFAEALGYSTISVKKWETGGARPGRMAIKRIQRLVDRAGDAGVILQAE